MSHTEKNKNNDRSKMYVSRLTEMDRETHKRFNFEPACNNPSAARADTRGQVGG